MTNNTHTKIEYSLTHSYVTFECKKCGEFCISGGEINFVADELAYEKFKVDHSHGQDKPSLSANEGER